jgi:hypothetical protein
MISDGGYATPAMFEASHLFLFFDYFRVPYRTVTPAERSVQSERSWLQTLGREHPLRSCVALWPHADGSRSLVWPSVAESGSASTYMLPVRELRLDTTRFYASVISDAILQEWLSEARGSWRPVGTLADDGGKHIASIWGDERGNRLLPFDPGEAIENFWSEAYRAVGSATWRTQARKLALTSYYRIRPGLPRRAQIRLRQLFSRLQARTRFPAWPIETALHDLYAFLFDLIAELAQEPVPSIAAWPRGKQWALVLTHDVETSLGYRNLAALRDVELETDHRSSWNFVPKRYSVDDAVVTELLRAGFEVGVHGLYHDGRDLESKATLEQRLPAIREYAERWNASGFRSPATHRRWELMPLLGFDYDSSYPDTDPFEPTSGGCCSWLPFFNQSLVELPITLPQDHTVFVILQSADETLWQTKTDFLRERGGMALLITHPDYLMNGRLVDAYRRFLRTYRDDATVWHALPRDVSAWWRRRMASRLEREGDAWRVVGPGAPEATVTYGRR